MGIAKPLNPETGVGAPTGYTKKTESMLDGFMQWPEKEWVVTHELAENMWMIGGVGGNMTRIVTGHSIGVVSSREDLLRDHEVQVTQTEKIAYFIKAGLPLEEIIALKPTAEFDEGTPKGYAWWGLHGDIRVITLYLGITSGKDIK